MNTCQTESNGKSYKQQNKICYYYYFLLLSGQPENSGHTILWRVLIIHKKIKELLINIVFI